ncbi:MAG: 1,4-dihydroxy-2-naphthoate polyprenyltransferase, partial [Acidimicrobiales bacterium]
MTEVSANAGTPSIGRAHRWVIGARPRTLAAAAVPVVVGTAVGRLYGHGGIIWWRAGCAAVVALAVQVGTNYANDYSDGMRGSDDRRIGPIRLTSSGLARPEQVRAASLVAFGVAGAAGIALAASVGWWLIAVGFACFLAGWLYTGGPKPYGYLGLGELFVFVFFGLVATAGSGYVQHGHLSALVVAAGVPVGLLSVTLLEANNLRDVDGDAASQKRTIAVRIGASRARWLYVGALAASFASVGLVAWWHPFALLALVALPLAWRPWSLVGRGA